jgi:hypothetical protein
MTMFPFGNTVLLRRVRTSELMNNTGLEQKLRNSLLVYSPPQSVRNVLIGLPRMIFHGIFEMLKRRKNLRFVF